MKRAIMLSFTVAVTAFLFAACGDMSGNKPANSNSNTNAAKTTAAAAPNKEALMALETKAFDAWKNKDTKFWEGFLADNYVSLDEHGKRVDKAGVIKMMSEDKCEVTKYTFSDEQMTPAGVDAAIITYKVVYEGKCDGKPLPTMWVASVYTRSGDTWKGANHGEIPAMDPNAKPADAPKPPPPAEKKAAPADDKKSDTAANDKPAPPADDPLVAVVRKGWEAWKSQDAKALGDVITKDFVLVNWSGRFDNAGAIKEWTGHKCEIKSFWFDDAKGTSMTKDMGIVTLKGSAEGACEGKPVGALYGTYLLVKDGDTWKAAMIFESPVM